MAIAKIFHECCTDMDKVRDPFLEHTELAERMNEVGMDFQLYGSSQEIAAMNEFVEAIKSQPTNMQRVQNAFNFIAPMVRLALRKELGIEE